MSSIYECLLLKYKFETTVGMFALQLLSLNQICLLQKVSRLSEIYFWLPEGNSQ